MNHFFRLALYSTSVALTLLLAACGGGGSGSGTSQPPLASSASSSSINSSVSSSSASSSSSSSSSVIAASCTIAGIGTINICAIDNGSWGTENSKPCVSASFCPTSRSSMQTALSANPVDVSATAATKKVYDYLHSIWGSKTLSGQQDLTWKDSIDEYQRVINDTGKAPAIMGYDFMNYGLTGVSGLAQTDEAIAHWNRGGLVAFCWHWREGVGTEKEFYTANTSFTIPVANGQLDTTSAAFTKIQTDVDRVAVELTKLQTAGVAVLWRPLHEASGGWFWWGRSRTDSIPPAYANVLLWRYMYDRLTNFHGLHNLIWVWNGQSAVWYPGDAYVDIVSTDIYDGTDNKTYKSQIASYNSLKQFPLQSKLVALSENSYIPDPDKIAADGAWWLWFMTWNDGDTAEGVTDSNNFWTGEYYNTNAHKTHVYNHANVVTLDQLPDFKKP